MTQRRNVLRSETQRWVLERMVAGARLQMLTAQEFGAVTGNLDGHKVDGRTLAALERKGLIEQGKETSPWARNMKLTKAGRGAVT